MAVVTRFIQRAEIAKASFGPELPTTFEPRLLLVAGRFDGSRANRPPSPGQLLVIHPTGMGVKIVLLPPNHPAGFPSALLDPSNPSQDFLRWAVPQLMAQGFDPL